MRKSKVVILLLFVFGSYFLIKPIYYYSRGIFIQYFIEYKWSEYKRTGDIDDNIFNIDIIGKIIIPSLDMDHIVLDGTSQRVLAFGPGRVKGSSNLENTHNNITIAAHRDSFFYNLNNISMDDEIIIEHLDGKSKYKVFHIDIVDKKVLQTYGELLYYLNKSNTKWGDGSLTLFTCYPFEFIGAAQERFIVNAKRGAI